MLIFIFLLMAASSYILLYFVLWLLFMLLGLTITWKIVLLIWAILVCLDMIVG